MSKDMAYYEKFGPTLEERINEEKNNPIHFRRFEAILEYISPNDFVLDAGGGSGYLASKIMEKGATVIIIDIRPELVQNMLNNGLTAMLGDIRKLPFPDNHFDVVICSEVLEHIDNPGKGLTELYRVLKPTGKLIVTMPCRDHSDMWHRTLLKAEIIDNFFLLMRFVKRPESEYKCEEDIDFKEMEQWKKKNSKNIMPK